MGQILVDRSICKKDGICVALTHAELAAAARGLGMTWAGILVRVLTASDSVRQWLHVPEGYTVTAAAMFGYGKYKYRRIPPRKPLSTQWM